ncbi:hypothetical protein LguiB_034565 [Lonicera macranthoides]
MGLNSSSSARLDQEVATPIDLQFKDMKEHYHGMHIAHGSVATVYGALILHSKVGDSYPFTKPRRETPLLLGEWWDANLMDVVRQATRTKGAPNVSNAYTINGQPGDLYNCSNKGPGQITDVLIIADQPPPRYYIAARAYTSAQGAPFNNITTTAILEYRTPSCSGKCASTKLVLASLPPFNDTATAIVFNKSFRSPRKVPIPTNIDKNLFITVGLMLQHFIL